MQRLAACAVSLRRCVRVCRWVWDHGMFTRGTHRKIPGDFRSWRALPVADVPIEEYGAGPGACRVRSAVTLRAALPRGRTAPDDMIDGAPLVTPPTVKTLVADAPLSWPWTYFVCAALARTTYKKRTSATQTPVPSLRRRAGGDCGCCRAVLACNDRSVFVQFSSVSAGPAGATRAGVTACSGMAGPARRRLVQ